MTLPHRTYSAARWITASTAVRVGLHLVQIAVLARLLTPQDYGLMALVTVVLSYVTLFSDMGLSTAFVQRQHVSSEERSSLYWLSVAAGFVLMLFVITISPIVARFFNQEQLGPMMMLVATNLLIVALGQQLRMGAEKSLNFKPVAIIEMASAFAGLAVAIIVAATGGGVYALVAASMVSTWVTMILSWIVLAQGWRPEKRLRWTEVRWFLGFGGGMVVNNVINHINGTVDVLLGGRLLGASQLGLYSVPRNLILQVQFMVNPILTRVGFPMIASVQSDKSRVREVYLKTMNVTASLNAPIYVALAVFAPDVVVLLLGPGWPEAAPLMRVLALWGLLRSFGNPVGSLLFGLGHVRLSVLWNAGLLVVVPPAIWVGSHWGAVGMAWAMTGSMAVLLVPAWSILIRPTCGAGIWEYSRQFLVPTAAAFFAGAVAWLTTYLIDSMPMRLAVGLPAGMIAYAAVSSVINAEGIRMLFHATYRGTGRRSAWPRH